MKHGTVQPGFDCAMFVDGKLVEGSLNFDDKAVQDDFENDQDFYPDPPPDQPEMQHHEGPARLTDSGTGLTNQTWVTDNCSSHFKTDGTFYETQLSADEDRRGPRRGEGQEPPPVWGVGTDQASCVRSRHETAWRVRERQQDAKNAGSGGTPARRSTFTFRQPDSRLSSGTVATPRQRWWARGHSGFRLRLGSSVSAGFTMPRTCVSATSARSGILKDVCRRCRANLDARPSSDRGPSLLAPEVGGSFLRASRGSLSGTASRRAT